MPVAALLMKTIVNDIAIICTLYYDYQQKATVK